MNSDIPLEMGPLTEADIADVAELHARAFPTFFLSSLGQPFLEQFYAGFLGDPDAIALTCRRPLSGAIAGTVGTTNPAGFFGWLLRRRLGGFAMASARAAVQRPSTIPRLVRAIRYRGGAPSTELSGAALLSSVCVDPAAQHSGAGRLLLEGFSAGSRIHGRYPSISSDRRGRQCPRQRILCAIGVGRDNRFSHTGRASDDHIHSALRRALEVGAGRTSRWRYCCVHRRATSSNLVHGYPRNFDGPRFLRPSRVLLMSRCRRKGSMIVAAGNGHSLERVVHKSTPTDRPLAKRKDLAAVCREPIAGPVDAHRRMRQRPRRRRPGHRHPRPPPAPLRRALPQRPQLPAQRPHEPHRRRHQRR